jgi:multidrug efflux pump subunit AcrB
MTLTRHALNNTLIVMIAVLAIVFLGLYSLVELPIQLFPDVENPRIEITTTWRAAISREMESQIVEPLERVLRGIPGMKSQRAMANGGYSQITLEFGLETDMQQTLLEVISRMNRLPPLPRDASRPVISSGGGSVAPALTFFSSRCCLETNMLSEITKYFLRM